MVYESVHNFNKYNVSNFNEITSVDSKFDRLNIFYKDFKKLGVKSQNKKTMQKKTTVLKNALLLYDKLFSIYNKEYSQVLESKEENWRQKHDYKNLKDLDSKPDQADQPRQLDQP